MALAVGCSDGSKIEEEKRLDAFREQETRVAFSNVNFGDTENVVKEKLGTTQSFTENPIYNYNVGEISVSMLFKYHNSGLYYIKIWGSEDNINHIKQVLTEKYNLSYDIGHRTENIVNIPGERYFTLITDIYGVGSRKQIRFKQFKYTDKSNYEVEIIDSDIEMNVNYEKSKIIESEYNSKKNDAKKMF